MDSLNLSPTLLKAGGEFLTALRALQLEPEGLLWAQVNRVDNTPFGPDRVTVDRNVPGDVWHLVLITSALDESGPSEMNELLFKAYDASATPKEISPFIVEVMSPRSSFAKHLVQRLSGRGHIFAEYEDEAGNIHPGPDFSEANLIGGLWFNDKWIYQLQGYQARYAERKKMWRAFKQSVNALAA